MNPLSKINPLVSKGLGSIVRTVLAVTLGAYLVGKGVWSEEQSNEYIAGFVAVAIPAAWSLYEKYKSQQKQNTTLAVMNRLTGPGVDNVTPRDIEDVMKQGDMAPATSSKDAAPVLKGTGDGIRLIQSIKGTGDGR